MISVCSAEEKGLQLVTSQKDVGVNDWSRSDAGKEFYVDSQTHGFLPREATRSAVLPRQVVRLSVCPPVCDVEVS